MDTPSKNKSPESVGIVILNYQGEKLLDGLFGSIEKLDYSGHRIFLIDNASTDGWEQIAENWKSKIPMEIIKNGENLLFSKGNNIGIKRAIDWGAEYVLLLNNDTVVPASMISELVGFMKEKPSCGIAGPMIHTGDGNGIIWGAGGKISLWWGRVWHRGIREKDEGQFSQPAVVDYVSGASILIRRGVFDKIGYLDERFPMYFEDTDFCLRARMSGFEVWYVPTAPLIHYVSVAAGGRLSAFKIRRRFTAGMKFYFRHARWYQWPTILVGHIYEFFRVLLTRI